MWHSGNSLDLWISHQCQAKKGVSAAEDLEAVLDAKLKELNASDKDQDLREHHKYEDLELRIKDMLDCGKSAPVILMWCYSGLGGLYC